MKYIFLIFIVLLSCNSPRFDEKPVDLIYKTDSIMIAVDNKLLEVEEERKHKEYILDSLREKLEQKENLKKEIKNQKIIKTIYLDTVTYQVDSSFNK